jgi:arginase
MKSMPLSLTVFQGRAGDRNDLGIPGALTVAKSLAHRLKQPMVSIGTPRAALNSDWRTELTAAAPDLQKLADHLREQILTRRAPITVLNRCAAAIATIPVVATFHPNLCLVWFDAHADLNTPESSQSGYLGGLALSGPAGLWSSGFGGNLPLSSIVLVGSRDLDPFESELIASGQVQLIKAGAPNLGEALIAAVANRPVYVHLDCDVLEPGLVPTDFSVTGGLSFESLHAVLTALARSNLIGLEIAEFQSSWNSSSELVSPARLLTAIEPLLAALLRWRASDA